MVASLFRAVDRAVEYLLFLFFLAFTLVGGLQVFNRFVLGLPLSWSEEFQKYGHIWMVMLAIPVAYRRGAHLGHGHAAADPARRPRSAASGWSPRCSGSSWRWPSAATRW